jgi:hypothetical protein
MRMVLEKKDVEKKLKSELKAIKGKGFLTFAMQILKFTFWITKLIKKEREKNFFPISLAQFFDLVLEISIHFCCLRVEWKVW